MKSWPRQQLTVGCHKQIFWCMRCTKNFVFFLEKIWKWWVFLKGNLKIWVFSERISKLRVFIEEKLGFSVKKIAFFGFLLKNLPSLEQNQAILLGHWLLSTVDYLLYCTYEGSPTKEHENFQMGWSWSMTPFPPPGTTLGAWLNFCRQLGWALWTINQPKSKADLVVQ